MIQKSKITMADIKHAISAKQNCIDIVADRIPISYQDTKMWFSGSQRFLVGEDRIMRFSKRTILLPY